MQICTMTYHTSEHMRLMQNPSTCLWWRAGVLVAVWACRWYWASCGWGCPALSCPYCWSCRLSQCLDRPESDSACSSSSSAMSLCQNIVRSDLVGSIFSSCHVNCHFYFQVFTVAINHANVHANWVCNKWTPSYTPAWWWRGMEGHGGDPRCGGDMTW